MKYEMSIMAMSLFDSTLSYICIVVEEDMTIKRNG